jgi:hypothetical protein
MRKATGKLVEIPHGKVMKKTAVNRFADSCESETRRLDLKRKMEHEEKMTLMHLKKRKYELRYGNTAMSHAESPSLDPTTNGATKQDKEIQILLLQIKLAEIKRDAAASTFRSHSSSPLYSEGSSTPSSSYSAPGALSFDLIPQDFDSGSRMMDSGAPTISTNYGMVEPHPAGEWPEFEFQR